MRVYVPDRNEGVLNEVLKELYMLQQAIGNETGSVNSRVTMANTIRDMLKELLEDISKENR